MKRLRELPRGHVFVFGSNEAGIHGRGAARDAVRFFGAVPGVGFGLRGQSFAIPTKKHWKSNGLPIEKIQEYVGQFLDVARDLRSTIFVVTPIGCGLAGYSPQEIAPLFKGCPENVILPEEFK